MTSPHFSAVPDSATETLPLFPMEGLVDQRTFQLVVHAIVRFYDDSAEDECITDNRAGAAQLYRTQNEEIDLALEESLEDQILTELAAQARAANNAGDRIAAEDLYRELGLE